MFCIILNKLNEEKYLHIAHFVLMRNCTAVFLFLEMPARHQASVDAVHAINRNMPPL